MKINIESIRKKDTANIIDFNYEIEEAVKNEYLAVLSAEKINFVIIEGSVLQKNGFAAIDYEIYAEFTAECARCSKETPQTLKISGEKYLADKSEEKEDNEDYYTLENPGMIDLREFISEFLSLEVPLRYLCAEDCMGLCQKCGKDLNAGECGCTKKDKNPAFKVLDDFFK
jgi:uncharacterized protein